ncbi:MAG: hypothetical protein IPN79_11110 [Saprospiraceae bacterium]|nr:hypothetical protein [Saprospiraceae bacterium]
MSFLIHSFYVFVIGFGLWTCQPKRQVPLPESEVKISEPLISSVSYGSDPDAEKWYKYNSEGEFLTCFSLIDTVNFFYFQDSIVKKYGKSSGQWQTSVTYFLDKNQKVESSIIRGENDESISSYRFYYDTEGYLTETVQDVYASGNTYRQTMTYENGNLKEIITFTFDGRPYGKYVYEYYKDKKNVLNHNLFHILEDYVSKERLGKGNKNLIRSMANVSVDGDTLSILSFTYPEPKNDLTLIQIESDVLNENTTERIYHFTH